MDLFVSPVASLLQTIIQEAHAENQRRHEEKMAEIKLISNSEWLCCMNTSNPYTAIIVN